jgi:hypothetical protein
MKAGLMSMQTSSIASGSPPCAVRSSANAATVLASLPSVNHAPQPGVVLADDAGHGLDRHGGDHGHQQRLEQQSEAAVWPRPWHADRLDAAPIAADPWHAGVEVGLMLEEVEMAPGLPLGVVGRAVGRAAVRTGKSAARGKVDLDVQPVCLGIEVGAGYRPRRGQP